jgi:uncharacterized protein YndB with AHSA1/START domain
MTNADAPDDAADSVIVECDLAEPPEKVWRALTVPDLLAAWLMPNDIRPEIGRRFILQAPGAKTDGTQCEVLAVEPHRLISYRWRSADCERDASGRRLDSVVTFVLTETETGGTHLRLVHEGFPASLQQRETRPVRAALPASRKLSATVQFRPRRLNGMRARRRVERPSTPITMRLAA